LTGKSGPKYDTQVTSSVAATSVSYDLVILVETIGVRSIDVFKMFDPSLQIDSLCTVSQVCQIIKGCRQFCYKQSLAGSVRVRTLPHLLFCVWQLDKFKCTLCRNACMCEANAKLHVHSGSLKYNFKNDDIRV